MIILLHVVRLKDCIKSLVSVMHAKYLIAMKGYAHSFIPLKGYFIILRALLFVKDHMHSFNPYKDYFIVPRRFVGLCMIIS